MEATCRELLAMKTAMWMMSSSDLLRLVKYVIGTYMVSGRNARRARKLARNQRVVWVER